MNPLTEQQGKLVDLLLGDAWFADVSVFADDGKKDNEIEAALDSDGFAVVVSLPVGGAFPSATPGKHAVATVAFAVELACNPARNAQRATPRDPVAGLAAALRAVMAAPVEMSRQEWEPVEFAQVPADDGLLVYALVVQTRAHFTA